MVYVLLLVICLRSFSGCCLTPIAPDPASAGEYATSKAKIGDNERNLGSQNARLVNYPLGGRRIQIPKIVNKIRCVQSDTLMKGKRK
jgi:hypothetical protein